MSKKINKKPKTVLILGSGGLKIGQAGEFDYSGSQAIKALKEEGVKTVLVNPNIATIQTSEGLADKIYFLPVTVEFVEKIIAKEKPDGILLAFGGQTALNCGVELEEKGILKKYKVEVLGTSVQAIQDTEDRDLFVKRLNEIGVKSPTSIATTSVKQAVVAAKKIGYPAMIRVAYALGGRGSGFCKNEKELVKRCQEGFAVAPQILVEEWLGGWKEVEYEVVRDSFNNCITVCNMENFDPLGIHTGESIVVAPSQTLSNAEYHKLREIAIQVIRHLGIIGECNIQYALDPKSEDYRIIEVNARLSRSSALASKATGYPLAFIAAKLALGYSLTEIENKITKKTMACFEPALDYCVIKMPRWDLKKFKEVDQKIGSEMKSVGEVMSIGRTFEEALQKSLRMIAIGMHGLTQNRIKFDKLEEELKYPTDKRVFAIGEALKKGWTINKIYNYTKIDKWFLYKLKNIVDCEKELIKNSSTINKMVSGINMKSKVLKVHKVKSQNDFKDITDFMDLLKAKQLGFSDYQISKIAKCDLMDIRKLRKKLGIIPYVKQIDTLAAEYPAKTNYLYLTYNGDSHDVKSDKNSVIVLGSGAYRIGSSVEFDWCCVNAVMTAKKLGYKTIMHNYNPETVSTDYDVCDRLYFDEMSLERVLDIYEFENPKGIIISMGGQIPNNLAMRLHNAKITQYTNSMSNNCVTKPSPNPSAGGGYAASHSRGELVPNSFREGWGEGKSRVKILGTSPKSIDNAENRHKFSKLLDKLNIDQPEWKELTNIKDAKKFAGKVGYPVLIRPSYVLSGAAMNVVWDDESLVKYLGEAADIDPQHPVVITKFVENSKEVEIDAVAKDGEIVIYAITEHIENAGVHSGDATIVLPAQRLYIETMRRVKKVAKQIARALNITGPFNIQFLAYKNQVRVIECNLRASRSFPFCSKVYKQNMIDMATRAILGDNVEPVEKSSLDLDYVGVKAAQFSFSRLKGADPTLGVEMASTGEVGCLGHELNEAFLKAFLSVGFKIPKKNILLSTGPLTSKARFLKSALKLKAMGYTLYGSPGTAKHLQKSGINAKIIYWPDLKKKPNIADYLSQKKIDLVINIPKSNLKEELKQDYQIRRLAVDFEIPLITNLQVAMQMVDAIEFARNNKLEILSWDEY